MHTQTAHSHMGMSLEEGQRTTLMFVCFLSLVIIFILVAASTSKEKTTAARNALASSTKPLKMAWPELEGRSASAALRTIKAERPDIINVMKVLRNTTVSSDHSASLKVFGKLM